MDVINAIIVRHQSSWEMSPSNAKRKAKAISFKATSSLANEHNKNVVRALWVSRQNSLHDNNYCCRGVNHRDVCTLKQTGDHFTTGSLEQIEQMHTLDLLQREHRDQRKQKRKQQRQKLHQKIMLSTSTTMTIAVIVARTSQATTHASSAASDGKESANKSSDYWSAGNYHLVILSKKEDGWCASQVPRK